MSFYLLLKGLHLLSFTAWVSGMVYLPLLFSVHVGATGDNDFLLQKLERKLLRLVINPAMVLTFVFGLALIVSNLEVMKQGWLHTKLLLVFLLAGVHGLLSKMRKDFAAGDNKRSARFYCGLAWIQSLAVVIIITLATNKPF